MPLKQPLPKNKLYLKFFSGTYKAFGLISAVRKARNFNLQPIV